MSFGDDIRNGVPIGLPSILSLGLPPLVNPYPALDLDFINNPLDSRITFSRGSQATLFDSTGTLVYAKHNLLLQSQEFDNVSAWGTINATVTANTEVAPDGTTTAETLTDDATSGPHICSQNITISANTPFTFSCFLKEGTNTYAFIAIRDASTAQRYFAADFNLDTGTVRTTAAGTSGTLTSSSITSVGNGWYRCVITGEVSAVGAMRAVIGVSDGTTAFNTFGVVPYVGTGTTIHAWGAELNLANMEGGVTSSLTTYYPTTTAAYYGPRFDYDPSTLAPLGLLIEEQRTNSIRNNTMQGAVAGTPGTVPTNWLISIATGNLTTREIVGTGVENGITYIDVRFVASGSFTASIYADSPTGVAASNGQTWTSSFYVKLAGGSLTNVTVQLSVVENDSGGNFLAGADSAAFVPTTAGLSTQRQSQTRTNTNASTAFEWSRVRVNFSGAGDVTLRIGLPQLELGAFATSVIPTTTTALTRSVDAASMTGTNFSDWFNAAEGTFLTIASRPEIVPSGQFPQIATISNGTTSNELRNGYAGATSGAFTVTNTGSTQANLSVSTTSVLRKVISAYKADDFAISINGSAVATDTSGTVPTVNQITFGARSTGGNPLNGHIQRITYYPQRLSDAQLQALTG